MSLRPDDQRPRVTAGKLDRKITIQRATTTQDPASGQPVETWATLATVWAEKSYRRANESLQADEVSAMRVLRFAFRWSTAVQDVNPKDRVSYDGTIYDITEVNEVGRREGIEIFVMGRSD